MQKQEVFLEVYRGIWGKKGHAKPLTEDFGNECVTRAESHPKEHPPT